MPELIEKGEVKGVEFRATRADGTHFPAEVNASIVKDASGQPVGIVGLIRDVTERARARENLARTGALLDSIRDAQSLYIAEHDPRPVFDALLETLLRMTDSEHGFLAEAMRDETGASRSMLTTRILAWDRDSARRFEAMEKRGAAYRDLHNLAGEAVLTGKLVICNDVPNRPGALKLPEGHPPLRAFMGVPLFFGGDLVGVAGIANRPGGYDERVADFLKPFISTVASLIHAIRVARVERRSHDALRESERRFREMMENVRLLAVTLDRDGRITFCNNHLAEFAGASREELVGRDWFETFLPPDEREDVSRVFREALAGDTYAAHHENDLLTRAGERRRIAWDNTPLRDAEGRIVGTASLGRDVTQQRELEDQVRQSQKMEAVGRLAGGVAHDLNNMLAPILGWAEILLLDMTADDPRRDDLLHVRVAAERARDLTRQLLAFSRKQVLQLRPVSLADVVAGFEKMLRRTIREDIQIHLLLHDDSGAVLADAGQIEQVLANLAVNAQDALPGGGEMTVEVSNVDLDDAWVLAHPGASPGAFVCLTVSDTGLGMPPQIIEHLFEPFFTTKELGQGTGLGLATVYGIVRQHGGAIDVESEPGRGSTFRIYLPRVDVPAQLPEEKASAGAFQGGRESILVVEDNDMVRELTCEMLRQRGYAVTGAASPEECIEAVEARRERVDLLVTDMIMPRLNGRDLYDRLTNTIPALRVVVMSGYAHTLVASGPGSRFGRHFLQKPFSLRALTDAVRAALDEKE
jgi:PAS domain S-box-containing protein